MAEVDKPRKVPPKFARESYAKARERLGLPPHPAKIAWDRRNDPDRESGQPND
jgi:hypothetical protein